MDLRKIPNEDEEPPTENSEPGICNVQIVPSTSRDNNNVPEFKVPEPPPVVAVATHPVLEVNQDAASGQVWTNKEIWQYMTLPFTITLALQNLSPYDDNTVRAAEVAKYLQTLQNANTVYGIPIPIDIHPLQQIMSVPSSLPAVQTVETRPIEQATPLVTPPLKRKSRRSKPACESKRKPNNRDVIPLPVSNRGPMNTPNAGGSLSMTHAAQQFSMPSTSKAFPEAVRVKKSPKENNQKQNIVFGESKNGRAEKRKREVKQTTATATATATVVQQQHSVNYEELVTPYILYCAQAQAQAQAQAKEPVQQHDSNPSSSNLPKKSVERTVEKVDTSKRSKEQGNPKSEGAKGILQPAKHSSGKHSSGKQSSGKHSKKVRFADQCAAQQSKAYKQAGPSKVTEIPRMVFPIYDKSSKSASSHSAHKEKNKEIWTIIDKVQPNRDDSLTPPIVLQKVTPSRSHHQKKTETAPVKERATQRQSSGLQKVSSSNSKSHLHQKKVETASDKRAVECSVVRRAPPSSQKKAEAVLTQQHAIPCSVVQKAPSSKGQYYQQPTTSVPVRSASQYSVFRSASSSTGQLYQTVETVTLEGDTIHCTSEPVDLRINVESQVPFGLIEQQQYLDVPPLVPFNTPRPNKLPVPLQPPSKTELLHHYSTERIRKAYNLHETLLAKLGGTKVMPERKLEIDLFRRDLILELIRKQFEVENIDQLRAAIMKHLGDEEKAKSYVDIIESITNEKYE